MFMFSMCILCKVNFLEFLFFKNICQDFSVGKFHNFGCDHNSSFNINHSMFMIGKNYFEIAWRKKNHFEVT